ncbi:MAG: MTH1187 family thiamine-binding protein [Candidatus Kapabacteria bacterium]|jgi:uncharacterized protein (TIGR00106 family)|nr:MTH1187 family thiamine-binding protein [Candidatus Kapabacteria bacterium]
MVLAEFAMFPTDKGESVSKYVSQVIDTIDKSGITYQLTPMGTILEGSWDEVMGVITQCFKVLEPQASRISTAVKVDYRAGDKSRMTSKIDKIQSVLGRDVKH